MATRRACDVCGMYRQRRDGSSGVQRYGLSVQVPTGRVRSDGQREFSCRGAGGIDLCDECWERIGKPNMRREA